MVGIYASQVQRFQQLKKQPSFACTVPLTKDRMVIEAVGNSVIKIGLQSLTVGRVLADLSSQPLEQHPTYSTVVKILRDHFALRYGLARGANLRYSSEKFDPKRQWVSRILAQLLSDDVLIVAIDESSFNSRPPNKMEWQPGTRGKKMLDSRRKDLKDVEFPAQKQTGNNDDDAIHE